MVLCLNLYSGLVVGRVFRLSVTPCIGVILAAGAAEVSTARLPMLHCVAALGAVVQALRAPMGSISDIICTSSSSCSLGCFDFCQFVSINLEKRYVLSVT